MVVGIGPSSGVGAFQIFGRKKLRGLSQLVRCRTARATPELIIMKDYERKKENSWTIIDYNAQLNINVITRQLLGATSCFPRLPQSTNQPLESSCT